MKASNSSVDADKKRQELVARIVKPMGYLKELEDNMREQTLRMKETEDG